MYGLALHAGHVVAGEAGVGPLVLPLDVLHGEAVAGYDNAASFVLMYRVSLQRRATLFIIMGRVATATDSATPRQPSTAHSAYIFKSVCSNFGYFDNIHSLTLKEHKNVANFPKNIN